MAVNKRFQAPSTRDLLLKRTPLAAPWGVALALLAVGCGTQTPTRGPTGATPEQVPASITISGSGFTFGFASGRRTSTVSVAPFRISKTPITVGQYKECVAGGNCSTPALDTPACTSARVPVVEGKTYDVTASHDGLPVTCVTTRQAIEYCSWVGGALPTVEQWVYAARGPNVQEFAWGSAAPTCAKHQRAIPVVPGGAGCCNPKSCDPDTYYSVAQRPDVESPEGLLDVLLTPTELLSSHRGAAVPACSADDGICVVRGMLPGAIDGAVPVSFDPYSDAYSDPGVVSGFRCAFEVNP